MNLNLERYPGLMGSDFIVDTPKIGESYHLSFASKKGMVWKLREVKGSLAVLETPKTKRPIKCHVSCLLHINRNAFKKAELRRLIDELY